MSQDMITLQIPMPVFVLTRLYANAEIGVPREELPFSVGTPVRTAITVLVAAPEFFRHSRTRRCPCTPRHSCEGRNLNQDMDALTYTPP